MTLGTQETINPDETAVIPPQPTGARPFSWESLAVVFLLLILALGAYFRFTGINWDEAYHLHPDERFLTDTANLLKPVENPLDYLRTSTSTLNPYNVGKTLFVYGNFPMTVTRYVGEWVNTLCTNLSWECQYAYNTYNGIHIVGRVLSGLMDLVAIGFLFLLGRRLYDWRVGLLAALLHALAVMPIQQSHFFTMDNWASGLTVVTLYTAVRAAGFGDHEPTFRARWYVLFGCALGLTLASRVNVAPLGAMIGLAGLIWLVHQGHDLTRFSGWRMLFQGQGALDLQRVIIGGLLAIIFTLITFRLAQPYAFTDTALARQTAVEQTGSEPGALELFIRSIVGINPQFSANMEEIQRLQAPEASFPPALQWTDRAAILFPLTNMILYGMGITAAIAAWLGFAWALWRIATFRPDWTAHLIPVAWTGGYFLFIGMRWVKSIRYFLPIYPTLFLLAAWALLAIWQQYKQDNQVTTVSRRRRLITVVFILCTILPSFLWANSFVKIYQNPVTRVAASDWIFENVPSGAMIIYETAGETRTLNLPLKYFEFVSNGTPLTLNFTMPEDGTITAVRFNYLSDPDYSSGDSSDSETLRVRLNDNPFIDTTLNLTDQEQAVTVDLPDTPVTAASTQQIFAEAGSGGLIRANTSILANEHWDDLLPISTNGRNAYGSYYTEVTGGQRPVTAQDNDDKRREVLQWLDEADYIMISSQRAVWHLPRLPLVYPMMIKYYQWLFDGTLGFELVAQFHATHTIGPLNISDTGGTISWGQPPNVGWPPPPEWAAEEAFSVYDHPPVWVFKKTDAYNHERTAELLGSIDLSNPIFMNPEEATQAPDGLMLTAKEWLTQRANGTFSEIFAVDGALNQHPALAAVIWWLAVIGLGWLAFPITFVMLRGLPDKGYALARVFSLLFISYFGWILASYKILPNTRATLLLGTAVMGLLSLILFLRHRQDITTWVRANLAYIAIAEAVGVLFYLIMIGVRLGNPDVWDIIWGGEKPMDLSYFTAVLKSTTFPPYDPWYAGGYINYYYYGFVYVGSITKLLGIIPALAYNLILPMLFSFTGLGVFSIAYNLVMAGGPQLQTKPNLSSFISNLNKKAVAAGLIAAMLAVLLGNLAEVGVLTNAWYKAGNDALGNVPLVGALMRTLDGGIKILGGQPAPIYTGDWFWNASRAINANPGEVGPITEFPFFTFLYGDLHAHMISLPLTVLALGWAVALALQKKNWRQEDNPASIPWWETALQWLLGGVAIGALRATNTWDWPTYLVIGGLAVAFWVWQRNNGRFTLSAILQALILIVLLVSLSILSFWPFADHYGTAYSSLSLWSGSYTHLSNYLIVYGLFLLFIGTHLLREFRDWTRTWTFAELRRFEPIGPALIVALVAYVVLLLALVVRGYWIAPVVLTLILASGLLGLRHDLPAARRIVLILISAALGLTLAVEIIVLDGDIGRMNTVFKFYMQVWTIFSVAAGVTAVWCWPSLQRRSRLTRNIWQTALGLMLFAAFLYPVLATQAKWNIRMNKEAPHTLNGMTFMQYVSYNDTNNSVVPLEYDYEAIQWMYRHIEGSPVIVEAHNHDNGGYSEYRSITNRIAMYTGLPAVVGWDWHQRQQRSTVPGWLVSNRIAEVNSFYNTTNIQQAVNFLHKYDVKYVYAGQLEWVYYAPEGMNKFDEMVNAGLLKEVYRNKGASIYEVIN